ncbi:RHS repeat domain-containing protein [Butyricimonas sp. Marseille-P3923]|uniref:RHS repeat domain-containing protein n=1 Tax=Butyricimonas sp. Marseille-P3923 TaxID=1987504 RepID=UPI0020FFFA19|nr:DUF6443 domain-containing protein [Butyricimonas sp. Marseille-P3923]
MKRLQLLACMLFLSLLTMGQAYPSLDLSANPDTIKVDGTQGYFTLQYSAREALDKQTMITWMNDFLQQQSWTWLRVVDVVPSSSPLTGVILVQVQANDTGEPRWCVFPSLLTGRPHFVYQYGPGVIPKTFTVGGNATIYPGKKTPVTLTGSEQGVTYDLYLGTTLKASLPGTGKSLSFFVTGTGNYTIKATRGNITQSMNGYAQISCYGVLQGKITVSAPPRVALSKDGESKMIPFTIDSEYSQGRAELEEIMHSVLEGECTTWDSTFALVFVFPTPTTGQMVVARGPNCGDTTKRSSLVLNLVNRIFLEASQPPGGTLNVYDLSGGGEIAEGSHGTVKMSGQQILVDYKLYCNDELVDKPYFSSQQFSLLRTHGRYRVKAVQDGREVWMNGNVGIWPKITRESVSGGGTIYNNHPVEITLPASQSTLTYRLLKEGNVVASRQGTGGALSFNASEPGTYTIEAGLQDYFVPMTGSVTVDRDNGVHYTSTANYVVETVYLDPTSPGTTARTVSNVTYLDGFGRPLQEIQVNGSPGGGGDIVTVHRRGVFGRVEREYVPYAVEGNGGGLVPDAFSPSRWSMFGGGDAGYMYTLTEHDGSPLDRVVKRTGPGKNWHEAAKGVATSYHLNGADEVRLYRVKETGELVQAGYYSAGSLQKVVTVDEDGKRVETYTDNMDRTVLAVNVESEGNRLETYSVHDDRGLLRYVLSPEASARVGTTATRATEAIRQFGYYYEHDRFGRLTLKQLPGCDPVYMVYDKRDRLVMSQDGKQRVENADKWSYSLYDSQNRVVETGEVVLAGTVKSHAALQEAATSSDNYLPAGNRTPLQYTLYDTYRGTADVPVLPFQSTEGYATGYHTLVAGLVTSVRTKVLGVTPEKWLTTTTYHDNKCRVIQTVSDNLQGGLSRVDLQYDFVGNVVRLRESHQTGGGKTDVLETVNSYDDRGRLLSSETRLNGGSPATVSYTYDAVGRLVSRALGGLTETLAYNARGWLTGKESAPFKMKLRYESPSGGSVGCWNGNISEWEWQQGTGAALMYGFTYDGVNRLTGTVQKQKSGSTWSTLAGSYLEKGITYDRNGNIKTLQRTANGTVVDNLVYAYTGNQLTGLTENVRTSPGGDVYLPGSAAAGSYAYDFNGNMINDSRRALNLSYNVLNLLGEVKTGSTVKASYSYLADGTKLRVKDGGDANGFDYLGSLTYKKSSAGMQLESASFGDGVIRTTGTSGGQQEVNYFLTDHLGSVRVIVDGNGVVKERNDYYPFGARHVRSDYPQLAANRFKFNGKEEQVTGGLGYLDYGIRMGNLALGKWFVFDPLQENYLSQSPYHFSGNNPIILRDKDGQLYDWYFNEKNELTYDASIHSQKDLDRRKIKGKYVGQTYIQGNVYYSLFGDIMNLTTWEGKLFKKIDELFINYFKYRKAIDKFDSWMQDEPIEKSVNFDIGLKFERDKFGLADGNMYPFKFQGSNAFYFVSEDRTKMNGIFELGDNKRKLNATISSTSIGAGYNMYINIKGSSRSKIIIFVFPTLESKNKFHKKMRAEYEKYQ